MTTPPRSNRVRRWCAELDRRLRAGEACRAEDYLADADGDDAAIELIYTEFVCREELNQHPDPESYLTRFPEYRDALADQFAVHKALHDARLPEPTTGQAVGPYELLKELGRGGRGAVFLARDRRDGRSVALKLLLTGEYSTPDELALFRHEAAVLARLDHPNLVRIYEAGVAEDRPYLALEYVDGLTLANNTAGFREPRAAAVLVERLARAVHHAHGQGVVHRDLKPSNILLSAECGTRNAELKSGTSAPSAEFRIPHSAFRTVKITDFGLARVLDGGSRRTRTGDIIGSFGYMAPEQAAGTAHRAGPPADVYALGAILYELLTGKPPFDLEPSALNLVKVLYDPPTPPQRLVPSCPRDLDTVCRKCLEKSPDSRYATALALADDLARFLAGKPVAARPIGAGTQVLRWAKRRPTVAALFVVIALALGGLFAGSIYHAARLQTALTTEAELRGEAEQTNADLQKALTEAEGLRAETRAQKEQTERQLDDTRRVLYALQLSQLPQLWAREPVRARELLNNAKACPPDLRDFTWKYFHRLCGLNEKEVSAHAGDVRAVVFLTPTRLLSTGADGKIRVWDVSGKPSGVALATAHPGGVAAAAATPDGKRFLTAGADRTVKLWDAANLQKPIRAWSVPDAVEALAVNRDGSLAAGAGFDGTVRVWDLARLDIRTVLDPKAGPLRAVAFAPDGQTLAAAGEDKVVRAWSLSGGEVTATLIGSAAPVFALDFSPDGRFLVAGGDGGEARVWDVAAGTSRVLNGHLFPVHAAKYSPDGRIIATGGHDSYLKLWDADTGQELTNIMRQRVNSVAFTPQSDWIAEGTANGRVHVFRVPNFTPTLLYPQPANVACLAALPDGGTVTGDATGDVVVRNPVGKVIAQFRPSERLVGGVAVSPDGTRLAVGAGASEVMLWDLTKNAEAGRLVGHAGAVNALAFDSTGRHLATGGADETIRLWDLQTRQTTAVLAGHTEPVLSVAFSLDGTRLASGGEDNTVRLWDVAAKKQQRTFRGHTNWVLTAAFHPSGKYLASGSRDRTVRVWNLAEPAKSITLGGYTNWVYGLAYSPDGKTLATASGHPSIDTPGEVKFCDPEAGYVRAILGEYRAPVAFRPDGKSLLAGVRGGVAELHAGP